MLWYLCVGALYRAKPGHGESFSLMLISVNSLRGPNVNTKNLSLRLERRSGSNWSQFPVTTLAKPTLPPSGRVDPSGLQFGSVRLQPPDEGFLMSNVIGWDYSTWTWFMAECLAELIDSHPPFALFAHANVAVYAQPPSLTLTEWKRPISRPYAFGPPVAFSGSHLIN